MPPSFVKNKPTGGAGAGSAGSQDGSAEPQGAARKGDPKAAKASLGRVTSIREGARGNSSAQYRKAMADLGFSTVGDVVSDVPYLIIATDGEERCGKTHFACTAPAPIAYFSFDPNYRYVLPKFKGKKIEPIRFEVPQTQDKAAAEWARFVKAYYNVLYSGLFRSAIVDTFTDVYRLIRMAEFGKTKQVSMYNYDVVNAPLFEMMDDLTAPDVHVNWVLIHKMTDEYVKLKGQEKEVRTGNMVRAGWKHARYKVEATLQHLRWDIDEEDEDGNPLPGVDYGFKVMDCGRNSKIVNKVYIGEDATFTQLAMDVYPDTGEDDWADGLVARGG